MRKLFYHSLAAALPAVLMAGREAAAQAPAGQNNFWHMGDWSWRHMMFGGGLMMILFWVVVIGLVVALILALRRGGS